MDGARTHGASIPVVGPFAGWKAGVSLPNAALILATAAGVAVRLAIRAVAHWAPAMDTTSVAAVLHFAPNVSCLRLLMPFRCAGINAASSWGCFRNDVMEGVGVLLTAGPAWRTGAGRADIRVAAALLVLLLGSAMRVARCLGGTAACLTGRRRTEAVPADRAARGALRTKRRTCLRCEAA